jgi:inner membrane protein
MASIGHVAVGLVAARIYDRDRVLRWPSAVTWSALALLPDVDVVGFALGVEYADPWGHRGATHSAAFAAALGLAIGLCARWFARPVTRTACFAILVLVSHPFLDTMTDGGLGCALWYPFDLTRYFAPWRPTIGFLLREDTAYTTGFSDDAFRAVKQGDSAAEVRRLLGTPAKEIWIYSNNAGSEPAPETAALSMRGTCATVHFHAGQAAATFDPDACAQRGIRRGMSLADVEQHLGVPRERGWQYTWSAGGGHHRIRVVVFTQDRVSMIFRHWK